MVQRDTPARRQCGTMAVHQRLLEQHPDFRLRLGDLEGLATQRLASGQARRSGGPTTIPVVVHVVYNSAAENISAAQINSQIATLNKDYRATNPDKSRVPAVWRGFVTDAGIQFALA